MAKPGDGRKMVLETDAILLEIRRETTGDVRQIRQINELAFERTTEADVIDRLRQTCPDFVSLVAIADGQIVGHILFTPAWLESPTGRVEGMGLAPLAVLPDYQNRGIGGKLIQAGLVQIQDIGCPFIIVLGHPGYYPRFGFERASKYGIRCEYDTVPEEAFMITIFDRDVLSPAGAVAHYRSEWAEAT
jgi:putative acetyltransferase